MGRSASRSSRVHMGRIRSALRAQVQYGKMYLAMKLRRIRVPTSLLLVAGTLTGFFMLGLLMLSVVVIDIVSTLFLLCRKLLGLSRHPQGNAFMPRS
ncbi:hypothetical protein FHU10_4115 [Serratia fonticola]|jgi:hypothetical protein|uniref:Uncharacterized protein n=1 Tax=Serratia fonticola TaxID=47917 RepID=A0A542BQX5_SERFO|nr:hypothetical protein [Serratia fonticola]TQI80984.1 hypothetical protein FHU09_3590 [Serratia fonticola]TQI96992.1 hypothetical protein FHU11_2455 [Serratia fonticola]TVZ71487.1 hypothetical protein FHU10_4115 [Serratia fonticola]